MGEGVDGSEADEPRPVPGEIETGPRRRRHWYPADHGDIVEREVADERVDPGAIRAHSTEGDQALEQWRRMPAPGWSHVESQDPGRRLTSHCGASGQHESDGRHTCVEVCGQVRRYVDTLMGADELARAAELGEGIGVEAVADGVAECEGFGDQLHGPTMRAPTRAGPAGRADRGTAPTPTGCVEQRRGESGCRRRDVGAGGLEESGCRRGGRLADWRNPAVGAGRGGEGEGGVSRRRR